MATHEFGLLPEAPVPGRRYDDYEPEKYHCISVDDVWIEPLPETSIPPQRPKRPKSPGWTLVGSG